MLVLGSASNAESWTWVHPEQLGDAAGGTIANAEENELWRMAESQAALMKVGVLGDDGVSVLPGERPDQRVAGLHEPMRLDVRGVGVEVENLRHDSVRQILIAEE